MGNSIQKYHGAATGEIMSLNIDDLDVVELERRLEMAVAASVEACSGFCQCPALVTCGTFCT
jgi:hypothetical protein